MKTPKSMTIALCAALLCSSTLTFAGPSEEAAERALRKKLKTIMVPKISFVDTRVSTVFEYLKRVSQQQDPDGTGVNFMLILKPVKKKKAPAPAKDDNELKDEDIFSDKEAVLEEVVPEPIVTIDMDNIPLIDAIRFIGLQTGMVHVVEPHAVVVMDKSVTRQKLELRIFNIDPRVVKHLKKVK